MTNQPKQKTPLQKVVDELLLRMKEYSPHPYYHGIKDAIDVIEEHLPEERQAFIDARKDGIIDEHRMPQHQTKSEDWFDETYGSHV